jgi:hypothetical protein
MADESLESIAFQSVVLFKVTKIIELTKLVGMKPDRTTKVALKLAARLMEISPDDVTFERVAQEVEFMSNEEMAGK